MNTNGSQSQELDDSDVAPVTHGSQKKFPVIEIFGPVIQGEGSQAGQQTMFIRFGGCDYRCAKCDSLHAVMPQAIQKHAQYLTAEEILLKLVQAKQSTNVQWVTFSGGNPCMHKLDDLVDLLLEAGFFINVETQGTLWQEWVNKCTMVTVSPKSMGMGEKFEAMKLRKFISSLYQGKPLCIKVVVFSAQDLEMALHIKGCVEDLAGVGNPCVAYYLSLGNPYPPVLDDEFNLVDNPDKTGEQNGLAPLDLPAALLRSYRELSEEVLADPRLKDFRFLPQLHVLVYGNEASR